MLFCLDLLSFFSDAATEHDRDSSTIQWEGARDPESLIVQLRP